MIIKPSNTDSTWYNVLSLFTICVWVINGLFCKLLNLVPRHQLIVARILGDEYPAIFTKAIGIGEVFMAIWILSLMKPRWCAITQIILIASMNTIEFFLAPDLLLFGRINAVFAFILISVVFYTEFLRNTKPTMTN